MGLVIIDSLHVRFNGVRYAFEEDLKSLYVDVNYNDETPTKIDIVNKIQIEGKVYPVKRVGARAFYGCRNITSVMIPSGIEFIDSSAFRWCVNLSNLSISSDIKRIGPDCFRNCSNLRNFHFPSKVQVISNGCFRASGLMSAVIPEGVVEIGSYAFEGCKSLAGVRLPNSLKKIGKEAFANCWALKNIFIHDQVRSVGEGAFMACRSLEGAIFVKVMDSRIKTIVAANAFAECKALKDVICRTGRVGNVKDVIFHEDSFAGCNFVVDNIKYETPEGVNPNASKRKKGDSEFDEDEATVDVDNAERLRTSKTVERARKDIGVRKNAKKKK